MAMMISKFHKLIQSKVVWIAFAALISIAFVWSYTGSSSGSSGARSNAGDDVVGRLYNEDVTRNELGRAYEYSRLMLMLQTGQQINVNEQVNQYLLEESWKRLAILRKAQQMGLTVSQEQLAVAIRQQPVFINSQTRQFDRNTYTAFFTQILPRLGLRLSPEDFQIMISENLLIEKASGMAAQGALVTESEIDRAFHVYADTLTVKYASIPRSMAPAPEVTEEDARQYYETYPNQFVYPDKVKVSYVEFHVTDYTNAVEVTDEMVTQIYNANKQKFVVEGTENNPFPEFKPLEEVRDEISSEVLTSLARREAANAAGLFVSKLSSQTTTFEELAGEFGKTIAATPPFAETDTVRGIDPTAQFARAAFSLEDNEHHYYSDPVVGKDSIYLLVLQRKMPSFLPDFEVIAEDAMSAAKITAAEKAYLEKTESVHAAIEAALEAGTSFEEAAGKAGLQLTALDPFSLAEPPEDDLGRTILQSTALFEAGTLVDLIPTEDEFIVAYIAEKVPADRFMADPMVISQLRSSVQNDKVSRLVSAWRDSILVEADFEDLLDAANNNS
jgi:hypothetical protein